MFFSHIKNAVSMYNNTKQKHRENALYILAMVMNSMVPQDPQHVTKKSPQRHN